MRQSARQARANGRGHWRRPALPAPVLTTTRSPVGENRANSVARLRLIGLAIDIQFAEGRVVSERLGLDQPTKHAGKSLAVAARDGNGMRVDGQYRTTVRAYGYPQRCRESRLPQDGHEAPWITICCIVRSENAKIQACFLNIYGTYYGDSEHAESRPLATPACSCLRFPVRTTCFDKFLQVNQLLNESGFRGG